MKTITEIKNEFASASLEEKKALCQLYAEDERSGVRKLIEKCRKEEAALEKEFLRMEHMMEYEHKYEHLGYLCGIDEVGRGPLAGPVVACAVILPKDHGILYLNDSKKLSEKRRLALCEEIKEKALSWSLGRAEPHEIDELNILHATMLAMQRAVAGLHIAPEYVLIDGNRCPKLPMPSMAVVKGDSRVPEISAASILAKVTRDAEMAALDIVFPQYGFAQHKGYPTAFHLEKLAEHGATEHHRRSFGPVKRALGLAS